MADHRLLLVVWFLAGGFAASAVADVVNFDDASAGGQIRTFDADRWRSRGVVFGRAPVVVDFATLDPFHDPGYRALGGSSPNGLLLNATWGTEIEVRFVRPGTNDPGVVSSVQVLLFDAEPGTGLGTVEAYNMAGTVIATVSAASPPAGGAVVEVVAAGIARLRIIGDESGVTADNLTFPTPGEPECLADFDGSGVVDNRDYFEFISAWFAELPESDVDGSGVINSSDFFVFLAALFEGC
jgi:hypothetical protein